MAKCDLAIAINRDAQALRPGDRFAGEVTIAADADVRCDALTLELRWVTDGKGREDSEVVEDWTLFAGDLRTGTRQSFPFAAQIPRYGPPSYRGKLLRVDWELRARADVPWAIDAKATLPLFVGNRAAPGAEAGSDDHEDDEDLEDADVEDDDEESGRGELRLVVPTRTSAPWKPKPALVVAVILAVVLGIALASGLWRPVWGLASALPRLARGQVSWQDAPDLFFGSLIVALAAVVGWAIARQTMIQRRLGEVFCEIEPATVRPGDTVQCVVRFTPRAAMQAAVTARLRATERCTRGSGKSRKTYRHVAYEQKAELSHARAVSPGLPFEARGAFTLPAEAPPSFWAADNQIEWQVDVAIEVPRWPDWTRDLSLDVVP